MDQKELLPGKGIDVAFSFLSQDEALAVQSNDRLKDRVATFIYSDPKRQATLAGRDGAEAFSRVFREEARTVVVLYRAGWGDRGFTETEATGIRNRASEFGWDFTTFIPLDEPPTAPVWLPRARLWIGLKRWGLDHAATVIESRVQEAGGTPKELTVADVAERAVREIRETAERNAVLDSFEGVEAARREFDRLFEEVQRACAASSGLVVKPERPTDLVVSMSAAHLRRQVTFVFNLYVSNSLYRFKLRLVQFDGSSEEGRNWGDDYHFDFGPSGEYGWREGTVWGAGEFFTSARLVDRMAMTLIEEIRNQADETKYRLRKLVRGRHSP